VFAEIFVERLVDLADADLLIIRIGRALLRAGANALLHPAEIAGVLIVDFAKGGIDAGHRTIAVLDADADWLRRGGSA